MGWLDGKVVLVTGGGSGLGRALVETFVDEGACVAVIEKHPGKAADLHDQFGSRVHITVGDVTTAEDNDRAVNETVDRFGRLTTFVGNAGLWDFGVSLGDIPLDRVENAYRDIFDVNVLGVLLGVRAALVPLLRSNGSMIITLSNASFLPGGGGALYTASKHAGVGIVRQLAYELEGRVRVNGVAPGGMATDLRGSSTLDQAELTVAEALGDVFEREDSPTTSDHIWTYVLLASDRARTTTGAIFETHGMLGPPPP